MDSTTLKAQIDTDITNKVGAASITKGNVGNDMKAVVDYTDQQVAFKVYKAKLSQSGTGNPTAVVLKNDTGKTFTFARNSAGSYNFTFSSVYADANKIDIYIHFQSTSFAVPTYIIDNLGVLATIETKYWNGTNFVVSDDILQNATIYLVVNN